MLLGRNPGYERFQKDLRLVGVRIVDGASGSLCARIGARLYQRTSENSVYANFGEFVY